MTARTDADNVLLRRRLRRRCRLGSCRRGCRRRCGRLHGRRRQLRFGAGEEGGWLGGGRLCRCRRLGDDGLWLWRWRLCRRGRRCSGRRRWRCRWLRRRRWRWLRRRGWCCRHRRDRLGRRRAWGLRLLAILTAGREMALHEMRLTEELATVGRAEIAAELHVAGRAAHTVLVVDLALRRRALGRIHRLAAFGALLAAAAKARRHCGSGRRGRGRWSRCGCRSRRRCGRRWFESRCRSGSGSARERGSRSRRRGCGCRSGRRGSGRLGGGGGGD